MPRKRHTEEAIIHKLAEADVLIGQGKTVKEVSNALSVTDQIYYRRRKAYGGMRVDLTKRIKEFEAENTRL